MKKTYIKFKAIVSFIFLLLIKFTGIKLQLSKDNEPYKVIYVRYDIEVNEIITKDKIGYKLIDKHDIKNDTYNDINDVVGKMALTKLYSGEYFLVTSVN